MKIDVEAKIVMPAFSFLIDDEDFERVSQYKWFLDRDGYVIGSKGSRKLHSFLIGKKEGFVVDHINRDKLDNRKCNLRHVTQHENCLNRPRGIGVYLKPERNNKWIARIKFKGKNIHLGYFNTKSEALEVRRKANLQYFGDYAFV